METITHSTQPHMGEKVARVRTLRGMSQSQLGELLGTTKQAISKMEQSEKITEKKLEALANALGVTKEGLKSYKDESVLYYNYNFYENCGVNAASIGTNKIENFNNLPLEKVMEIFEKLLEAQNIKINELKAQYDRNDKINNKP